MQTPHRDARLEINGLEHHLNVWDGGGGLTVLLLHGWLDLGRNWTFLVEALPDTDWHIVAPDWRGHGETEWVGRGGYYHFADYVRDLDQMVAALKRDRVLLVGHSMGAGVVGLYMGTRPHGADGFAMLDGYGPPANTLGGIPERFAAWLDDTSPFDAERFDRPMSELAEAVTRMRRANPRLPEAHAERLAAWATRTDDAGRLRWRYDPLHRTRAPAPMLPEINAAFWRRIEAPGVWIGGEKSLFYRPEVLPRLDDLPAHVERRVLSGAGHMVQNDAPEALAAELVRLADRV